MLEAAATLLRRSLLLIAFHPLFVLSQEATVRSWSIEGDLGVASTYRTLLVNEQSTATDFILQNRNDWERPRMGYAGTITIARRLGTHWKFRLGLSYGRHGYIYEHSTNNWLATDGVSTDPALNLAATFRSIDEFRYLGLPIGMERDFGKGRFRPLLRLDVAPAWMSAAKYIVSRQYSDGSSHRSRYDHPGDMNRFNLFTTFQAGFACSVNERLRLLLLPYGSLGVLEIIDAPITARLWSVGVMTGVGWDL